MNNIHHRYILLSLILVALFRTTAGAAVSIVDFGAQEYSDNLNTLPAQLTANTASIQAALNNTADKTVYVPANTAGSSFKFNGTLNIPAGKVFYGPGRMTFFGSGAAITIGGNGVYLQDITLVGQYNNTYLSGSIGVKVAGTYNAPITNLLIKNLKISKFGDSGIFAECLQNSTIKYSLIENVGVYGIRFYGAKDCIVTQNTIRNISPGLPTSKNMYGVTLTRNPISTGTLITHPPSQDCEVSQNQVSGIPYWKGLDTHGGRRITFMANNITRCQIGIGVDEGDSSGGGPKAPAEDITIVGNQIDNQGTTTQSTPTVGPGILALAKNGTTEAGRKIKISGNIVRKHGSTDAATLPFGAITVSNWEDVTISGNQVSDSPRSAINLRKVVRQASILDNTIQNLVASSGVTLAILMESSTIEVMIDNNDHIRTAGPYTAHSATFAPASGYGVTIGTQSTYTGAITVWKSGSYYTTVTTP